MVFNNFPSSSVLCSVLLAHMYFQCFDKKVYYSASIFMFKVRVVSYLNKKMNKINYGDVTGSFDV